MGTLAILLLLLALAEPSFSLSPADCEAAGPKATEILNQINERRRDGYQFQLLRVVDAHTDVHEEVSTIIHYLVLDVIESDCSVFSGKPVEDCQSKGGKRPTETVIGICKVVAVTHPNTSCEPELTKVIAFNCTTSSVSSALTSPTSEPVIIDYFENPEQYKEQAEKALKQYQEGDASTSSFQMVKVERALEVRGGERTTLYLDFSIANRSAEAPPPPHHFREGGPPPPPPPHHFFRSCPVFGFCQADFVYNVENPDLNNPDHMTVNCEIFNVEDSRNFSSGRHFPRHHGHFGGHGHRHPPPHHQHSPEDRGPPPTHPPSLEEREPKQGPQEGRLSSPDGDESEGTHPPPGHGDPHPRGPQEPCPLGPNSHKRGPHGPGPHGPRGPHGPHGSRGPHGPHGHGPHGRGPHGRGPHGHGPHGHGPCRHGPPPGHFEEQHVYRLPPLKKGEVLSSPEISIPSRGCPHSGHRGPPKPEIQPFPQTSSESCPGNFKHDSPQLSPFFGK